MTSEDIERPVQHSRGCDNVQEEEDNHSSEPDKSFQLQAALAAAQSTWKSGSPDLDLIAEKLADESRDASWRLPIGDSGLLDFFLGILPVEGVRQSLLIQALRLVGNTCADTDENRARVVESKQIPAIVKLFSNDALLPYLIPVIYNVCVDYEPAQLEACEARLSSILVSLMSGPRLDACRPLVSIICKILKLLISQEPEVRLADPRSPTVLLDLAVSRTHPPDLEDFCGLTSTALAYLTNEQFQTHLLESDSCALLMQCFEDSISRFDIASADPEEAAELKQIWSAFVKIFADISASPCFASLPMDGPTVQRLATWLGSSNTDLQTAACLSLGNLARSDEASTALLNDVYEPISAMLMSMAPSASQLQHAVLSFLKNLAIPGPNKPILGRLLLEPADEPILSPLWSTQTQPQTQFAAISLTRLLVSNCPANVSRLCAPLSPDPAFPAHKRTNLHLLISTTSRSDAEPTKLEGGRTVAAVCKSLHTPSAPTTPPLQSWDPVSPDTSRKRFYAVHAAEIAASLATLLTQRRFPALRSEVLFTMALMSRSTEGAEVVNAALQTSEAFSAVAEAVTGRSAAADAGSAEGSGSVRGAGAGELDAIEGLGLEPRQASVDPAAKAGMGRIDRENGLVLVAELLRQDASGLPPGRRSEFEEILKTGGEMVVGERQRDGTAG